MMTQPGTRVILQDLIHERSSFILELVKNIFEALDSKNSLALTYTFIAELDGIALNYLCVFDDYPLAQVKDHLINRYQQP